MKVIIINNCGVLEMKKKIKLEPRRRKKGQSRGSRHFVKRG